MLHALRQLWSDTQARVDRYFRTRYVVKTLKIAHAVELAKTPGEQWPLIQAKQSQELAAVKAGKFDIIDRRSVAYPNLPQSLHRLEQPIVKNIPWNLRRFSETPIPRRAINLIKNAVVALPWKIDVGVDVELTPEIEKRIRIATTCFWHPNNSDSYKTLAEAVLEDTIIGGFGAIEPGMTVFYKRPFKMWAVDGATIEIYPDWTESSPEKARYAQRSYLSQKILIPFRDEELVYIRDNVRTCTPFGLGKLEVAFLAVNAFLNVQDAASNASKEQTHKKWLWFKKPQSVTNIDTLLTHIDSEEEGKRRISVMSGMDTPEVIDTEALTDGDMLLAWQEFLIRIIAQGFDLSPMALGLERDVNRNTGEIMSQSDFRSAVLPMARRFEEAFTNGILHKFMGWKDLRFKFIGLEDPDMTTKLDLFTKLDALDALLPDEIREDIKRKPIPGGFGQLTRTQRDILKMEAQMRLQSTFGKAMQMGELPPPPPVIKPPMPGTMFTAADVAQMKVNKVQQLQQMKLLPKTIDLHKKMQDNEPGIFETLSDELRDFFEAAKKKDEEIQVQPEEVTPKDDKEQKAKFNEAQRRVKDVEKETLGTGA